MALIHYYSYSQAKKLAEKQTSLATKVKYNHLQLHKGRVSVKTIGFAQKAF